MTAQKSRRGAIKPVRLFLLQAIGAYERAHGVGPTVGELAVDLGLPDDFGLGHLLEHLRSEVERKRVVRYRNRFALTPSGRLALEARGPDQGVPGAA